MRAQSLIALALVAGALGVRADDGPTARFQQAGAGHYSAGRSSKIDMIVIHTVEGTQESAVAAFRSGARKVSAHYVVGDDGSVVQCVKDEDTAFHAKGVNARSVGIEHAGFADRSDTWTRAKYEASAKLARALCDRHGIPIDREHIVGHVEVPGTDHHDPGPFFDWDLYMKLIRGDRPTGSATTDDDGLAPPTSASILHAVEGPAANRARRDDAQRAVPEAPASEAKRSATGGITGRMGHAASAP